MHVRTPSDGQLCEHAMFVRDAFCPPMYPSATSVSRLELPLRVPRSCPWQVQACVYTGSSCPLLALLIGADSLRLASASLLGAADRRGADRRH